MATPNPSRYLTDSASDERGLALKMAGDKVLMAYRLTTTFADRKSGFVAWAPVGSGKSWDFPIIGLQPSAEYHTPGQEEVGQTQATSVVNVTADDILKTSRFLHRLDDFLAYFSVYEPFLSDMGQAMAETMNSYIFRMQAKAARTAASSGYHSGGNVVSRTGAGTTIADAYPASGTGAGYLLDDISKLALQLDEDNVPRAGRKLVVSPYAQRVLSFDTRTLSRDYGTQNSLNDRIIAKIENFDIYVDNSFSSSTNYVGGGPPSNTSKYDIDFRYVAGNVAASTGQPIAIAFTSMPAVAAVEEAPTQTFIEQQRPKFGTLMVSWNMFGLGVLRPWCAGLIQGQLS